MDILKIKKDGSVWSISTRRMREPIQIGTIEPKYLDWVARYKAVSGKEYPMSFPRKIDARKWIQQKFEEGLPDLPPLR